MKQKTILFVIQTAKVGGAAKMLKYVANLLSDEYEKIGVLTIFDKERPSGLSDRVFSINLNIKRFGVFWWRAISMRKIRKNVKQLSADVVCAFISDYCVLSRLATLGLNTIFVSAERGDPFTETFPWTLLVKWAYKNSDFCLFQLDKARDFYGPDVAKKSFVIPNVFIPEENPGCFNGIRRKTIVSAGRFVPEKNYEVLIEAFSKVLLKYGDYQLIIYGDGPKKEDYLVLCEQLGISDHVHFPGYVEDFAKRIRGDGVFVLSSKYEGIPNTLIEALAVGIPCVSTDCTPGGPYFLTHGGKTGLLVPVDDVNALSEAILRVITDKSLSDELSSTGPSILLDLSPQNVDGLWRKAFATITDQKLFI